jgi:hypothetical protein
MLQLLNSYMAELKVESLCVNVLQYILFWLFKKKEKKWKACRSSIHKPFCRCSVGQMPSVFLKAFMSLKLRGQYVMSKNINYTYGEVFNTATYISNLIIHPIY